MGFRRSFVRSVSAVLTVYFLIGSFPLLVDISHADPSLGPLTFAGGPDTSRDISQIYWPMMGRDISHTGTGTPARKGLKDPTIAWSDPENSTALGAVAGDLTANVAFDPGLEREVFCLIDSNLTTVMAREGGTGKMVWSVDVRSIGPRVTNALFVSPALMDTNDDGKIEVLSAITDGNDYQLALFEPSPSLTASGFSWDTKADLNDRIWLSPNGTSGPARQSSPCIHDLNSDGVEDVIIGTGNRLSAHHGTNGSLMWRLEIGGVGEVLSTPAIYPGVGPANRIVVNSFPSLRQTLRTTIVNFQGAHLKNVSVSVGSPLPHPGSGPVPVPVLGDLTGDGVKEIVVSYPSEDVPGSGRLICYTSALEALGTVGPIPGSLESYPALADFDRDGSVEIAVHSRVFTTPPTIRMACYDVFQNGTSKARWVKESTGAGTNPLYSPPLACDLDRDSYTDMVFASNGRLHALGLDGRPLWNITIQSLPFGTVGAIGDLGPDDLTDLYIKGSLVSQALMDLRPEGDGPSSIYVDDPTPTEGRTMNLNCLVRNAGSSNAKNVLVRFLGRAGAGPEELVGEDVLEEVQSTAEATVRWTPSGPGEHTITVQIDPANTILETDEGNNNASRPFTVAQANPDLTVREIRFIRGDGKEAGRVHLIENDPSSIVVIVKNLGDKKVDSFTVEVLVEGETPQGSSRYVTAGPVGPGGTVNATVPWTPGPIPYDQTYEVQTVEAMVDPAPGSIPETNESNNYGVNQTAVKNDTPVGSYLLEGLVLDPEGDPDGGARAVLTLNRTMETLQEMTDENGEFSFDLAFLDLKDADEVYVRTTKGNSWGEASKRVYSEDGGSSITIRETDLPIMSLALSPIGDNRSEVGPGTTHFKFLAQNTGNLPGNVTLTRSVDGNSSLMATDIELDPSTFFLSKGSTIEVDMAVSVPNSEKPGATIDIGILAIMTDQQTTDASIRYYLTVGRVDSVLFELRSQRDQTVDPNVKNSTTFTIYLLNTGNVRAQYNISADPVLNAHCEYVRTSGSLEPAQAVLAEVIVVVPSSASVLRGELTLRTSGQGTLETWLVSITALLPDLEAIGPIGFEPAGPIMGEEVRLIASIRNNGKGNAGEFEYAFFDGNYEIGTGSVSGLGPGEEVSVSDVRWTASILGEHEVVFRIDPASRVQETVRDNNAASRKYSFVPDLSVMSIEPTKTALGPGEPFSLFVKVENEGNAPLTSGFRVSARSGSLSGKELASTMSSLKLVPGKDDSAQVELQLNAPSERGDLKIIVVVSPDTSSDGDGDPSDDSYELTGLKVVGEDRRSGSSLYYVLAAVAAVLLLGLVSGGIFLWRKGGEIAPPPSPEGASVAPAAPGVEVTAERDQDGIALDEGLAVAAPDESEGPVMMMALEGEPPEGALVAEVLDETPSVPEEGQPEEEAAEEGVIPEI